MANFLYTSPPIVKTQFEESWLIPLVCNHRFHVPLLRSITTIIMNAIQPKLVYHVLFSTSPDSFFFSIFLLYHFFLSLRIQQVYLFIGLLVIPWSGKVEKKYFWFLYGRGYLYYDSFWLGWSTYGGGDYFNFDQEILSFFLCVVVEYPIIWE